MWTEAKHECGELLIPVFCGVAFPSVSNGAIFPPPFICTELFSGQPFWTDLCVNAPTGPTTAAPHHECVCYIQTMFWAPGEGEATVLETVGVSSRVGSRIRLSMDSFQTGRGGLCSDSQAQRAAVPSQLELGKERKGLSL